MPTKVLHDNRIRQAIGEIGITQVLSICMVTILDCGHKDLYQAIRVVRNICKEKDKSYKKLKKKTAQSLQQGEQRN